MLQAPFETLVSEQCDTSNRVLYLVPHTLLSIEQEMREEFGRKTVGKTQPGVFVDSHDPWQQPAIASYSCLAHSD